MKSFRLIMVAGLLLTAAACAATPAAPPPGPAIPTCFDQTLAGSPDGLYTAYNQLGNLTLFSSTDGSCTGASLPGFNTVAIADTSAEALAICVALDPMFDTVYQPPVGFATPEVGLNWWTCTTA